MITAPFRCVGPNGAQLSLVIQDGMGRSVHLFPGDSGRSLFKARLPFPENVVCETWSVPVLCGLPSETVRHRITEADSETLLEWSDRILEAQTLDEVLH